MKTILIALLLAVSVVGESVEKKIQEPCGSWGPWHMNVDGCAYRCRTCFDFGVVPPTSTKQCEHQWPCSGAD